MRVLGAEGQPRFAAGGAPTIAAAIVYDAAGTPRVSIGQRREDGSFGLDVHDAQGMPIVALPERLPDSP